MRLETLEEVADEREPALRCVRPQHVGEAARGVGEVVADLFELVLALVAHDRLDVGQHFRRDRARTAEDVQRHALRVGVAGVDRSERLGDRLEVYERIR